MWKVFSATQITVAQFLKLKNRQFAFKFNAIYTKCRQKYGHMHNKLEKVL